jgi:hypothetical protein
VPISPDIAETVECEFRDAHFPGVRDASSGNIFSHFSRIKTGTDMRIFEDCANTAAYGFVPTFALSRTNQIMTSTGRRTDWYCESVTNYNGPTAYDALGMCLEIKYTSQGEYLGQVDECFLFSAEGGSFRPSAVMLAGLRSLWKTYA